MWLRLDEREHATVMAALRYWQRRAITVDGLDLDTVPETDIATNAGALDYLGETEIDALCERINTLEKATELEIEMARGQYADDECEIDDDAMTSRAEDGTGTWISAWVWTPTDETGQGAE